MAVPAAPTEGGGDKILFGVFDNGGSNAAATFRARKTETLNSTVVGDLSVYTTSGSLGHGHVATTGANAIQITSTSTPCQGVIVKAHKENAATIYVGTSAVTADYTASTGGYPLEAGESVGVPTQNANLVYVRGSTGDGVAWIASKD